MRNSGGAAGSEASESSIRPALVRHAPRAECLRRTVLAQPTPATRIRIHPGPNSPKRSHEQSEFNQVGFARPRFQGWPAHASESLEVGSTAHGSSLDSPAELPSESRILPAPQPSHPSSGIVTAGGESDPKISCQGRFGPSAPARPSAPSEDKHPPPASGLRIAPRRPLIWNHTQWYADRPSGIITRYIPGYTVR